MTSAQEQFFVEADFQQDWAAYLREQLTDLGCRIAPNRGAHELAIAFFNARKRRILPRPRTVLVAKELACPPEWQAGVDSIRAKAERGDNLSPHLSTAIELHPDADDQLFNDLLLNDWGIYHFHLGSAPHPVLPHFVERTADVLLARVTDDAFYMIAIIAHQGPGGRGNWSCQELVEIIHRNWPESIRHLRLEGVVKVDPVMTDEDVHKLRKAGITYFLQTKDGTVYQPLGGGYVSSRVGVDVAEQAAYY